MVSSRMNDVRCHKKRDPPNLAPGGRPFSMCGVTISNSKARRLRDASLLGYGSFPQPNESSDCAIAVAMIAKVRASRLRDKQHFGRSTKDHPAGTGASDKSA